MIPSAIVNVAVEHTVYHFDKPFSYYIPSFLEGQVQKGCRVLVPFGGGNTKRMGIVLDILTSFSEDQVKKLKPVFSLLDEDPVLSEEMLLLASWMSETTFCTLYDAIHLMLPIGMEMKLISNYFLAQEYASEEKTEALREILPQSQWLLVSYLFHVGGKVSLSQIINSMAEQYHPAALQALIKKEIVLQEEETLQRMGDVTAKMVRLTEKSEDDSLIKDLSVKQKKVVEALREIGTASVKELCYFSGVTDSVFRTLEKKGFLFFYEKEIYRNPYAIRGKRKTVAKDITLTEEQNAAYQSLVSQFRNGGGISLLYGVTGSGKTAVFLKLIQFMLQNGRDVIVMVPEISLTPQVLHLFHENFGENVAVFHSGLSMGERMDEWKRVKRGEAHIVVGTRSAVFAPLEHIGLIVMDEEQEYSYKSEASPRFHARDIARFRTAYQKGLLLLCSATPSLESYYLASVGKYTFNQLPHRYGQAALPEVRVVDMRQELSEGNASVFSRPLVEAIDRCLKEKKQAILLLNRRGYQTFLSCRACGEVITCPNCSISLTYHSANQRMMCHYCGYSVPLSEECPHCRQKQVKFSGFGTQRAEEELQKLFPQARVLRMDTDTTMAKFSHEEKLDSFLKGDYDILLGTQMVAKGLNFEKVTLVGVLSADQVLYSDDFRSYERAFSLLTQVVGRSGRGSNPGVALIQTQTPEHPIIQLASQQNYKDFFKDEIALRRLRLYPPFSDLCIVVFVSMKENSVQTLSDKFYRDFSALAGAEYGGLPLRVTPPTPAAVYKINQKYYYKMIIKCKNGKAFRALMSRSLKKFGSDRTTSDVTVYADINPDNIL